MPKVGSVTLWLEALKDGSPEAMDPLWSRYFNRLVAIARHNLDQQLSVRQLDEDVALSALTSLWQGARRGKLEQVRDRDDLWKLLLVITLRKVAHYIRDARRQKRGGFMNRITGSSGAFEQGDYLDDLEARGDSPEIAVLMAEECRRRISSLSDHSLQVVAVRRAQGYAVLEIAEELGCSRRSVARKLEIIRSLWSQEDRS